MKFLNLYPFYRATDRKIIVVTVGDHPEWSSIPHGLTFDVSDKLPNYPYAWSQTHVCKIPVIQEEINAAYQGSINSRWEDVGIEQNAKLCGVYDDLVVYMYSETGDAQQELGELETLIPEDLYLWS